MATSLRFRRGGSVRSLNGVDGVGLSKWRRGMPLAGVYVAPQWVSPTAGSTITGGTPFVFTPVKRTTASHFNAQVATQADFSDATNYRSDRGGFEFSDGTGWYAIPTSGMVTSYSAGILATSGLVGYWRCNNPTSPITDSVGSNNFTYVSGTVAYAQTGALTNDQDASVSSSGSSCWSKASWTLLTGASARSLEGWMRVPPPSASNQLGIIYYGSQTTRSVFGIRATASQLNLETWGDDINYNTIVPWNGSWHHVVGTYDGVTALALYLDGVQVATKTLGGVLTTTASSTAKLGGNLWDAAFTGNLDEVALYNRVLTASEVATHYSLGKGVVGTQVRLTPALTAGAQYVRVRQSK